MGTIEFKRISKDEDLLNMEGLNKHLLKQALDYFVHKDLKKFEFHDMVDIYLRFEFDTSELIMIQKYLK